MNWLIAHQQEILIGILTSAVVAIGGYFLSRWFGSKKQPDGPILTAQGGKIADSPVTVANGSNITQNVNSPTTVHLNVSQSPQQALPKLKIEIREVCFDDTLNSLMEDMSGFTVDRYIFLRVWMVNSEAVATAVKGWKLTYSKGGATHATSEIEDFSKWHQHVKSKERGHDFLTEVIKDARNKLTPFPLQALEQGIPSQGWICFKADGVTGMDGDEGTVELTVLDSFDQEYRISCDAPVSCKGDMVNPQAPW